MSFSDFSSVVRPKVDGSWNLHSKFQDLDFFIMLSSSTGIIGNGGQGNYASGGVFQDALCHYRRGQKLPATTIDLGQVKTVGWVASTGALSSTIENMGIGSLSEEEVHELIEMCIKSPSLPGQIITGIKSGPGAHWDTQAWTKDARFSPLKYRQTSTQPDGLTPNKIHSTVNIMEKLLEKPCAVEEERKTVVEAITRKLSKMFMVAEEELLRTQKLSEIGVDSLVAVELRNWLNSQVGISMSIFELMNSSTLQELAILVLKKWKQK
jgi:acyl carrier protein